MKYFFTKEDPFSQKHVKWNIIFNRQSFCSEIFCQNLFVLCVSVTGPGKLQRFLENDFEIFLKKKNLFRASIFQPCIKINNLPVSGLPSSTPANMPKQLSSPVRWKQFNNASKHLFTVFNYSNLAECFAIESWHCSPYLWLFYKKISTVPHSKFSHTVKWFINDYLNKQARRARIPQLHQQTK